MKVQNNGVNSILNQYNKVKSQTKPKKVQDFGKEKMEISTKSKEVEKLAKKISLMPKIRSEVVERVKREIESGNYPVDVDKIAQAIINDIVV
jgi:flagellar biosynthesis anti-sigma factor FlgM